MPDRRRDAFVLLALLSFAACWIPPFPGRDAHADFDATITDVTDGGGHPDPFGCDRPDAQIVDTGCGCGAQPCYPSCTDLRTDRYSCGTCGTVCVTAPDHARLVCRLARCDF